jgi:hypothetical protein
MQGYAILNDMTKLLEQGIQAARDLPPERQDMAGELLLTLASGDSQYRLTREQIEDLKLAVQEADRGEFAAAAQIADTWKKFGL